MSYYKRVNYYELCRLCTSSEGFKIHIFCEDGKRRKLQHKIQICLPLQVNENDSLPKIVCAGCLEKIEHFYDFREHCISSESMLESYFTSMKTSDNLKDGKVYIKEQTDSSKKCVKKSVINSEPVKPMVVDKGNTNTNANVVKVTGVEMMVPPLVQQQLRQQIQQQNVVVTNQIQQQPPNTTQFMISLTPTTSDILQLQIKDGSLSSIQDRLKIIDQLPALLAQNKCKPIFINNEEMVNSQLTNNSTFIVPSSSGIKVNQTKNKKTEEKINNQMTYTNPISTLILNDSQNSNGNTNVVSTIVTPTSNGIKTERNEIGTNYGSFDSQTNLTNSLIDNHFNQSLANMNQNLFQSTPTTATSTTNTSDSDFMLNQDYDISDLKLNEENPGSNVNNNNNSSNNNNLVVLSGLFMCELCEKTFKRKEHLIQHRKLHTGERPFSCTQCGKSFSRKEHLIRHSVSHTGTKSFQCDECQKSFSRKDNLHKHKKTHVAGGPYVCEICNRNFVIKHYYQAHKKAHEEEGRGNISNSRDLIGDVRNNRKPKMKDPSKKADVKIEENVSVNDSFEQSNQMQAVVQNAIPIAGNNSQLAQILTNPKFREKYQLKMERSDLISSGIIVFNKHDENDGITSGNYNSMVLSEKKSQGDDKMKKTKSPTPNNSMSSLPNNNVLFSSGFIKQNSGNSSRNSQFLGPNSITFDLNQKQN